MDRLWSPWRSNYIKSFSEKNDDNTCVFCSNAELDVNSDDNLLVYKGRLSYVMLNLYPYNNGHLLVIPNYHFSDFTAILPDEMEEMMSLVQLSIKALQKTMSAQGFNFGANLGRAAGAGIDSHLHFHIVPRWVGDINFMPVIGDVKVISQDLLQTKKELVKAFETILNETKQDNPAGR